MAQPDALVQGGPGAGTAGNAAWCSVTRRSLLRGVLGGAALLLAGPPDRSANGADHGTAGEVKGTALGSGATPTSPPAPMTGLTILLLPRSDSLLGELERARLHSRDSLTAYRAAIPDLRRSVDEAVARLRAEGQGSDVRSATVDAGGHFTVPDVSSGPWILVGYRSLHVDRSTHDTVKESGTFLPQPKLVGYDRVAMWLEAFSIESGQPALIELTDRNVWFEGVEEKTAARERIPNTGGNRRRSAR